MMDGQLIETNQEVSTWDNYKVTFDSYQAYLEQKVESGKNRFELDFVDLLYASNYKGGSGSIQEDFAKPDSLAKLALYSDLLKTTYETFGEHCLKDIEDDDLIKLVNYAQQMIDLCEKHHIKGLGVPYCSALFHLQFPNLFPVIDRNVLLGIENIVDLEKIQKSGHIWRIGDHYIPLIEKMYVYVRDNQKSLREADKNLFNVGKSIYGNHKQQTKP